jgi:predicted site-specific integrase-resolvase
MKLLVNRKAIALLLGVAERTVGTWTREGRIPCVRITAKVIRYDADDVIRALKEGSPAAGGEARNE